ncbi:amidohydrolase family protein [Pandoraea sp. NPDC087047]|uniref:amidohydrolase family protein n=1 Tax=Pandoraea sp. NPDC087047 TaxID=3364390 RepID=UPI0038052AC7
MFPDIATCPSADAPPCAGPLTSLLTPAVQLPPQACDCHFHILGPADRYPYSPNRIYTPPDCLVPDYVALRNCLGLSRCVVVQPSVYGSDNTVLVETLRTMGDDARGVVVLDDTAGPGELADLHALGVRGVRVNLVDVQRPGADLPVDRLLRLQERVAPLGWHLELLVPVDQHPDLYEALHRFDVPLVFGHMGYPTIGTPLTHPGMAAMLALMQEGRAWAKLTAPYRLETGEPPYHRAQTIARWLVAQCPRQVVWGTDWPHVMVKTRMPHDVELLEVTAQWIEAPHLRHAIFAENPARLYQWH